MLKRTGVTQSSGRNWQETALSVLIQRLSSVPIRAFQNNAHEESGGFAKAQRFDLVQTCSDRSASALGAVSFSPALPEVLRCYSRIAEEPELVLLRLKSLMLGIVIPCRETDWQELVLKLPCPILLQSMAAGLRGDLEITGSKLKCTLTKERNMPSSASLGAALSLGSVELSLKDFLSLRPGDTVEFERPAEMTGVLSFAGNPWATVSLDLEDDAIKVKILDIIGRNGRLISAR